MVAAVTRTFCIVDLVDSAPELVPRPAASGGGGGGLESSSITLIAASGMSQSQMHHPTLDKCQVPSRSCPPKRRLWKFQGLRTAGNDDADSNSKR